VRQVALLESGGRVDQVTLLFNAATGQVKPSRSKEESHDYRYFPDPDLPPLVLASRWIDEQGAALPELPEARRARLIAMHGLSTYHAQELTLERPVADYYESVVGAGADPKAAAGWVLGDVMAGYNAEGDFAVAPGQLAELIGAIGDGTVSHQAAKQVYVALKGSAAMTSPRALAASLGLVQVQDTDALAGWVDEVLAAFPAEVLRFRGGETKLLGFFVGQVMKRSGGKADPKGVQGVLRDKLSG
jgi:aspartyl-tRNA(Asn)/glutamyl-tRNA(Gln) amidotransferase subunit B